MNGELWSARRIAQEYGWTPASARQFIRRYGLKHVTTEGPRDTRLYDPTQVRAAKANMPGRGHYRPEGTAMTSELTWFNIAECACVTDCAEHPPTACSLSGEPHVHPELGRCPLHPDAPGDWPAADLRL